MSCSTINKNLALACENPSVAGVQDRVLLANFEQWAGWLVSKNADGAITQIVPTTTSEVLYEVQTFTNKVRPMSEKVDENGRTLYKHMVGFEVAEDTVAAGAMAQKLSQGRFVAIVISNSKQIRVYGENTGLKDTAGTFQNYYENSASFQIALATLDETPEQRPPAYFVGSATNYDFATALAEIEALLYVTP
jgi:hypothetical protein